MVLGSAPEGDVVVEVVVEAGTGCEVVEPPGACGSEAGVWAPATEGLAMATNTSAPMALATVVGSVRGAPATLVRTAQCYRYTEPMPQRVTGNRR